jgi:D-amino-acid dehydrogenase
MARAIVVVGGGVVGLCCAAALARRGAEVTVVDAGPRERAASHVNAGWIVPTLAEPVPAPGLVGQSLKWMLRPDSPLLIAPRFDPAFLRWLLAFWRACNARDYRAGREATAALGARTMALYDDLRAAGVAFEQHQDGLLFAYRDDRALGHDHAGLEALQPFGFALPPLLSGEEARGLEPALSDAIAGGYWLERERSVRPDSLVSGLRDWLLGRGVVLRDGERVVGMAGRRGTVTAVVTDRGTIDAEAVVVAAGAWSPQVLAPLGVRLPVEAGKGYAIDFALPPPLPAPIRRPLYLHETRVAITPLDGMLRLAGTMELSGLNDRVRPARVRALAARTGEVVRGWPATLPLDGPGIRVWQGPRPLTPDGLPAIGLAPGWSNLAVATGHSMLGVTLAPATGEAIADLLCDGRLPDVIRPFAPGRFA